MANVVRSSLLPLFTVVLLLSCGCSGDETTPGAEAGSMRELNATESATAEWLGRAYSEGGSSPDLFFQGFWMSDSAFYGDTQAWRCIFEHVVGALGTPERTAALDELVALAEMEPAFPRSHRDEIKGALAALPESERIALGGQVMAAAEQCADVRLGLFGGGGPVPVCIYDRTDVVQRAEIVASTMGATQSDDLTWTAGVEAIAESCYQEVADAYGAGETLDWVEDLEQGFWERAESTTTTNAQPEISSPPPPRPESRSVPSPEWIGLEYDDEMDHDVGEIYYLDVRTTPPTRLALFGGYAIGGFYSEPFGVSEFYTDPGMNPEEPGDRLVFIVEYIANDVRRVVDAITVSQHPNERLLHCELPDTDAVLAVAFGTPGTAGVTFSVIDAWALSVEEGFQPADVQSVRCTD